MHPEDFLNSVVTVNVVAIGNSRGSLVHAVNAILTLDAFAGILFSHLQGAHRAPCKDDSALREIFAKECPAYQIVRDASFALKHGTLHGKTLRLVSKAGQIVPVSGAWDEVLWDRSTRDEPLIMWIDALDDRSMPVDVAALDTLNYFQSQIYRWINPPA